MATGGSGGMEEKVSSLPGVTTDSPTFIDFLRSPTWMYPTSRFFGDALYGDLFRIMPINFILYAPPVQSIIMISILLNVMTRQLRKEKLSMTVIVTW